MPIDTTQAKAYIRQHISEIQIIQDVAEGLKVSHETLRKEFRRQGNIPLSAFIAKTRVEQAQRLLHSTNLRCFEICYQVGFAREDSGAKTFKRLTGMTMEEYRHGLRNA